MAEKGPRTSYYSLCYQMIVHCILSSLEYNQDLILDKAKVIATQSVHQTPLVSDVKFAGAQFEIMVVD